MFVLGAKSIENLRGVHPSLQAVVKLAIRKTPIDFGVYEGVRDEGTQREYVAKGVSWTMDSKHLVQPDGYGHAVDLVPYVAGKMQWNWNAIYPIAAAVREAAIELGVRLRWGGTWSEAAYLPPSADSIEDVVDEYVRARKAAGKKANIDGPHWELIS